MVQTGPSNHSRRPAAKRRPMFVKEHYWLCDVCSVVFTLAFDVGKGVMTVPLPKAPAPSHMAIQGPRRFPQSAHGLPLAQSN